MKKILFITNRNIANTCGELRLIKNRAISLYEQFGIVTDFLLFTNKKITKPEPIGVESSLYRVKYNQFNPFSIIFNSCKLKKQIKKMIKENGYSSVIISGSLVFQLVNYVKKINPNATVIADVHGAAEELIEYSSKRGKILRKILYKKFKRNEKSLSKFDYIMAVSEGLQEYLVKEDKITCPVIKIPCAVKRETLNKDDILKKRISARQKYNIQPNEKLFIYSGGVSPWQCLEQTVEIFNDIIKEIPNSKLLILSGDKNYISKFKSKNVLVDSLSPNEVDSVLPAGDFAFLLREKTVTNLVAYPNKFLEYVKAGVKVIGTENVVDVAKQIKEYNLGYILEDFDKISGLIDYCLKDYSYLDDIEKRQELINDTCFENRVSLLGEIIK